MYDVIVIGKGPAGLSAALYLSREGYKVLVVGRESNLEKCNLLSNYLGINSISGTEFINIAENQVKNIGVIINNEKVLKLSKIDNNFNVLTDNNEYTSKTIILALGNKKGSMKINNIDKFIGRGVSYCVSCDGFFYKNKNVGVIGSSEYAVEEALNLKNYTDNITIYTNGRDIDNIGEKYVSNLKIFNIDKRKIQSLYGENELTHIIFDNKEQIGIDGIFIANDIPNIDDLSNNLGLMTKNNKIILDENNMTSVKGIFACGDMINDFKQVSTAVGSGAIAGYSCIKYLIELKLGKETNYEKSIEK